MWVYLSWVFVALSLIGNLFVIKKSVYGYWLWILANLGWIVYDFQIKAYSQSFLFFAYLLLAIWGVFEWSKKPSGEKANG
ncbi:MAG: nicotinamide mononucleotide transporter [Parachlamydiales bacterium]|jgi:nicotinamide riboside transporter PnuC